MFRLAVFYLFIVCSFGANVPCRTLAQEGSTFYLSYDFKTGTTIDAFEWKANLSAGGPMELVSSCSTNSPCTNKYSPNFVASVNANFTASRLDIHGVTRKAPINCETIWAGYVKMNGVQHKFASCFLHVFYKPTRSEISCSPATMDATNTNVTFNCTAHRIYPDPICRFFISRDLANLHLLPPNLVTSLPKVTVEQDPVYYSRTCLLQLPVSGIKLPGVHFFGIIFHPDHASGIDRRVQLNNGFLLFSAPVAKISEDCPHKDDPHDGYTKEGDLKTCECLLETQGFPLGRARWLASPDQIVAEGDFDGSPAVLQLGGNHSSERPMLTCNAFSEFSGYIQAGQFQEQLAYGPKDVKVKASSSQFTLCQNENIEITFICTVPRALVNPRPNVVLIIDKTKFGFEGGFSIVGEEYRFSRSLTLTNRNESPGMLTVKCVATNSIFSDLYTESTTSLTFTGPPTTPPVVTINGSEKDIQGTVVHAMIGQLLTVTCRVKGGYPEVSSVFLNCGTLVNSQKLGSVMEINIKVHEKFHQLQCSCSAHHQTGCYNLKSDFTIDIINEEPDQGASSQTGNYIGAGVSGAVVLVIVIVAIVFYLRKRRGTPQHPHLSFNRGQQNVSIIGSEPSEGEHNLSPKPQRDQEHSPSTTFGIDNNYSSYGDCFTQPAPPRPLDFDHFDQHAPEYNTNEGEYEDLESVRVSNLSQNDNYLTPLELCN